MNDFNTVEENKIKIRELLKNFRECKNEKKKEEDIYIEIYSILHPIIESIVIHGNRETHLPNNVEKMSPEELLLIRNEYNSVFIEDIALAIENGEYDNFSEERFIKILNLLECMIDNNIRSYDLF